MKNVRCRHLLLGACLISAGAGCDTTATRIQEKAAVFSELNPAVQAGIRRGDVGRDFSPELTYMALGKPNLIESSADGREVTWTYMAYNTPQGGFAVESKHAISSDILGSKNLVLGIGPGRTDFGGETVQSDGRSIRTPTLADNGGLGNGEGATGWRTVAGRADMDRGELQFPDPTVRPKSAMEMIQSDERQDLQVKFLDGKVVALELIRI